MPATKYDLVSIAGQLRFKLEQLNKLTSENLLDGCLYQKKDQITAFLAAVGDGSATDAMYEALLQNINTPDCLNRV